MFSEVETQLAYEFLSLPQRYQYRWSETADNDLRRILFRSISRHNQTYFRYFFPQGSIDDASTNWSLRDAQGAVDGAEYLPAARGTACGHIFKPGESTYACKTCAVDDTCVLCTKCFESSDHEGHQVFISISPGNSGCCDCGDREAWKKEVICSIHTDPATLNPGHRNAGKAKEQSYDAMDPSASSLPRELVDAIRMTISRSMDFVCDVFSCSPEQMRLPKTEATVRRDEERSRLSSAFYGTEDVSRGTAPEFCMVLWNDEKHTIDDVMNQVARACAQPKHVGRERAIEVNDVGRSVIYYSTDVKRLIEMAAIIEQLKLTVTIRSARDTFREQMAATIINWLADISGCAVGPEPCILRNIVCEEMLQPWRTGSRAGNKDIGVNGLDDHEVEENHYEKFRRRYRTLRQTLPVTDDTLILAAAVEQEPDEDDEVDEEDDNVDETDELDEDDLGFDGEDMDLDDNEPTNANMNPINMELELLEDDIDVTEVMEARHAGYPAPPPPPRRATDQSRSPNDSDDADMDTTPLRSTPFGKLPKTPNNSAGNKARSRPGRHWTEAPEAFRRSRHSPPYEDLWQRIRLDWLILYDLRLWKTLRVQLRHLYISTVVVIPQFKRIVGLRFAALYPPLAQLYLVADREPDHSIINLSIQILTTPTITEEVVERGNFLTNLMAILYTFLTTRQVGYPDEVSAKGTLAFDAGTVSNRRIFHFFMDLRWLFQSTFVQRKVSAEPRYLLQFLDLARLHQGICPNIRAIGEHVEYESDTWMSAGMIIKEIAKLCRQIALSYNCDDTESSLQLQQAIRTVAQVAVSSTFGFERRRFFASEIKAPLRFHTIGPFTRQSVRYKVPDFVVQKEHISFHHPLHYLLSWLIQHGLSLSADQVKAALTFSTSDYKDPLKDVRISAHLPNLMTSDLFLAALFDAPLRVAAWLAQSKASMWVRNGVGLRHQANAYRLVGNRDIGYQRDIFIIQTGLTLMPGKDSLQNTIREDSFLAQMIDRFEMTHWIAGNYAVVQGFEESQQLDVLEEFYHLLVIALSERSHLMPYQNSQELSDALLEHDIAHALCFKPLSFSEITSRVTEKVHEADNFSRVLHNMAVFRPPEGLSDTGVFELKPEYIELVDPFFAHFTRNAREEAENVYRRYKARKTGQQPEDIVYEPKLQRIQGGVFKDLAAFTRTSLFAAVIFAAFQYAHEAKRFAPNVPSTRIETFLHMVLHLLLIAVNEDVQEVDGSSFIRIAASEPLGQRDTFTVVSILEALLKTDDYASCRPAIKHVLDTMRQKAPGFFAASQPDIQSRARTDSPASLSADEREKKKQAALARQARVMAQMKEQQNSFLKTQGLAEPDTSDELDDFDDKMSISQDEHHLHDSPEAKQWAFPSGTCILCQEATDGDRTFGTFAYVDNSNILRSTPVTDPDYVEEVLMTPESLDRPYESRPFGVAAENKLPVLRTSPDGTPTITYKQQLSKGFPQARWCTTGPVSTSCGHIMHFKCFEVYYNATTRRHQQQIARNHPEDIFLNEFICPLCKALGNMFLPIVWKSKECTDVSELATVSDLHVGLEDIARSHSRFLYPADGRSMPVEAFQPLRDSHIDQRLRDYANKNFSSHLLQQIGDKSTEDSSYVPRSSKPPPRRPTSISSLFRFNRNFTATPSMIEGRSATPRDGTSDPKLELGLAYNRVHDSLFSNKLTKLHSRASTPIDIATTLAPALGLSISACEIAQRGAAHAISSGTLIDAIPEQTIAHLRVLNETAETVLVLSGLDGIGCQFGIEDETRSELPKWQDSLRQQLFGNMQLNVDMLGYDEARDQVMLAADSFLMVSNWLIAHNPPLDDAVNIIRLCLWSEVVKTIFIVGALDSVNDTTGLTPASQGFVLAVDVMREIRAMLAGHHPGVLHQQEKLSELHYAKLQVAVRRYALTFVRKCLILLHVRFGIDFVAQEEDAHLDELTRTCQLLHVEHPDLLLEAYLGTGLHSDVLKRLASGWISTAVALSLKEVPGEKPLVQLPHPAIFELIGLPTNYDTLTEEAIKRRCPTTGREVTDPALCLHCGDIFCSQAVCCMLKDDHGGCWQHMQRCGLGNMGMFINIRKCMVLLMHGSNGSYLQAPYLDKHGETDPTLRRHHQLFLNQKRYDKLLRDVWLSHGVQNVISRKLDAENNPGGWQTL